MDDGISSYIDWAASNGFGVVDVNIPQYISPTDTDPYMPKSSEPVLGQQMKELLCYLWDNYFEVNTASSIFLMGVGEAYLGIKQLLTSRGIYPSPLPLMPLLYIKVKKKHADSLPADKDAKGKIPGVLSFVSGSLRPVKSDVDQYLSQWYKSNSLIYVSPDHACWSDEDSARKVRKNRFGKVEKGDVRGMGGMLRRYVFLSLTLLLVPLFLSHPS
jgi:histone deacetylase 6